MRRNGTSSRSTIRRERARRDAEVFRGRPEVDERLAGGHAPDRRRQLAELGRLGDARRLGRRQTLDGGSKGPLDPLIQLF